MNATRRFNQLRLQSEAALDARRQRLAELLARENEGYVAEIQTVAETPDDMRSRLEARSKELKDKREAERVRFVEEMNYKKWRAGCDDLREADSKNFLLACHLERDKQVLEKIGRAELEERENKLFDALWEEMRQAQVTKETAAEKVLLAKNEEVKKVIAEQLEAIAARRAEDAKILEQEAEIQKEIWALEAQEERRKAIAAAEAQFARNQELMQFNVEKLKEREEALRIERELDLKFLDAVLKKEAAQEAAAKTLRRLKARGS